ncbi:ribonuclease III domain-containing protein [Leptodontidium sp. 2 PMI_412]|nr:ribonuclease III domain-containing protein [Leptodontidium sp. 2 PMI_412]
MTRSANQRALRKRRQAAAAAAAAVLPAEHHHDLEQKLGHAFADPTILQEALQAAGNGERQIGDRTIEDGNKRLALLGDSIMTLVLLRGWYKDGESRKSGHDALVAISSNKNLNERGQESGLSVFINKNKSFPNGVVPPRTMSDTVEALIGAVFVDSSESLEAVKVAMTGLGLV